MSTNAFRQPLRGIIPPVITPLSDRDTLDRAALERILERMISAGVKSVFVLGTTGEGPSLSYRLRREVIETTTRVVNRRVPVLAGITDTAFVESVNVARAAWITAHGYTCAGCRYSNHQPHSCTRDNPLTMDHLHPIGAGGDPLGPLIGRCRRGNGARGARPDPVR